MSALPPLIPEAWHAGEVLWDSPLPSEVAIAAGEILPAAVESAIGDAWGGLTGRLLGSTVGAWSVVPEALPEVISLFGGDRWSRPETWIAAGSTAASLVLSGLGVAGAVAATVPVVGQVVAAITGAVAALVAAVIGDDELGRPREEHAPPVYSREADESWSRQLVSAARWLDQTDVWRPAAIERVCYHPAGHGTGCPWGVGYRQTPGTLTPGAGYWGGAWSIPGRAAATSIGATRPSSQIAAQLLEAIAVSRSGATWAVDAERVADHWLELALRGLWQPVATVGVPFVAGVEASIVGGGWLVRVPEDALDDVRQLVPSGLVAPPNHRWPLYRQVPQREGVALVQRARASDPPPLWATRPLMAALKARRWAAHQRELRASTDLALLALPGQPGYSEAAVRDALSRPRDPATLTRIRDPEIRREAMARAPGGAAPLRRATAGEADGVGGLGLALAAVVAAALGGAR